MCCALYVGAVLVGHGELTLASLAVPPLFIVVAKTLGLYDRDEHLLHKTTLDEMPALVGLATLTALLLWLSGDLVVQGSLGRVDVLVIWATLLVAEIAFRAVARSIARGIAPVERCLLVGDGATATELRENLIGSGLGERGARRLDPGGVRRHARAPTRTSRSGCARRPRRRESTA